MSTGKALVVRDTLRSTLEQRDVRDMMTAFLPSHITPERMVNLALAALSMNRTLLDCSMKSIVRSVLQAAQLGLEINSPLKHAWLVPFRNKGTMEATLIPGYQGLIYLARRCDAITLGEAVCVYGWDEWALDQGTDAGILHRPNPPDRKPTDKDVVAAYFRYKTPHGETGFDWMWKVELDAVRARSKAKDSGPWATDTIEMYRKTVTKRGLKYVAIGRPQEGLALATAVEMDNRYEEGGESLGVSLFDEDPDGEDLGTVGGEIRAAAATAEETAEIAERVRQKALEARQAKRAENGTAQ